MGIEKMAMVARDADRDRLADPGHDAAEQPDGYEVRYSLDGKEGTVRMAHDPGQRIPVENGRLVLTEPGNRQ